MEVDYKPCCFGQWEPDSQACQQYCVWEAECRQEGEKKTYTFKFECCKCHQIKAKTVSESDLKILKTMGLTLKMMPFVKQHCDDCEAILVKNKKCKRCGKPVKHSLAVFCSEECHRAAIGPEAAKAFYGDE
jgi:hypothetical protein